MIKDVKEIFSNSAAETINIPHEKANPKNNCGTLKNLFVKGQKTAISKPMPAIMTVSLFVQINKSAERPIRIKKRIKFFF